MCFCDTLLTPQIPDRASDAPFGRLGQSRKPSSRLSGRPSKATEISVTWDSRLPAYGLRWARTDGLEGWSRHRGAEPNTMILIGFSRV